MDRQWIAMIFVWLVVEFIQFLLSKPYPQRMKSAAKWSFATGFLMSMNYFTDEQFRDHMWLSYGSIVLINGLGVLAFYWIRKLSDLGIKKLTAMWKE